MKQIRKHSYPAMALLAVIWLLTWLLAAFVDWSIALFVSVIMDGPEPNFGFAFWWTLPWMVIYTGWGVLARRRKRATR